MISTKALSWGILDNYVLKIVYQTLALNYECMTRQNHSNKPNREKKKNILGCEPEAFYAVEFF